MHTHLTFHRDLLNQDGFYLSAETFSLSKNFIIRSSIFSKVALLTLPNFISSQTFGVNNFEILI